LLASIIGALVIQATVTSMYAVGVPANAVLAIKGLVVVIVLLLYSEQVRALVRRFTGQRRVQPS
jgi:simple sugar transport system permease protein